MDTAHIFTIVSFPLIGGLDWLGLAWIGLDWLGLVWIGLDWFGLVWFGLVKGSNPKTPGLHDISGGLISDPRR